MGKRGPPPKPAAEKKLEGTYRKDRDGAAATVQATPGEPPMPKDLSAAAKRRWTEIVPELLRVGALAVIDGGALEAYCRAYARWVALETAAQKKAIVTTPFGPKVNPAGVEARKLHKEIVQPLELALGLHYAARSRVKWPEKAKPESEARKFLFNRPRLAAVNGQRVQPAAKP